LAVLMLSQVPVPPTQKYAAMTTPQPVRQPQAVGCQYSPSTCRSVPAS
jgi:hypothetical protein